jgi:hypothetical protein
VSDLAGQIQRVRQARPGAVPLVELHAAPMQTKFGKKSKPFFKIVEWRGVERSNEDQPKLIVGNSGMPASKEGNAFDDTIPW